jgi:signal transduction histidine kinase
MNVKQKWSVYTMAILVAGIGLQVACSYAIGLWGARYGGEAWLQNSFAKQVPVYHDTISRGLLEIARQVSSAAEVQGDLDPAAIEGVMKRRFAGDPQNVWAWIPPAPAAPLTNEPLCQDALLRVRASPPKDDSFFLACGTRGLRAVRTRAPANNADLLLASPLDDKYAHQLNRVTGAETLVFVRDTLIASSLDGTEGKPVPIKPSDLIPATHIDGSIFTDRRATFEGYPGYPDAQKDTRLHVGAGETWYFATRRFSIEDDIVIVLLVPEAVMAIGARYNVVILSAVSIVLLTGMCLLVWKLVSRFSDPIAALSKSAQAVSKGDLNHLVPVPSDAEMGEFCRIYNSMLQSMAENISLQKKLAREAGRSEIAVGVLHNVGNVLNSVNVSACLALKIARESKVVNLQKAGAMLEEHSHDLMDFLSTDPQGKRLPPYLSKVSVHLVEERDRTLGELDQIVKSVEHIKTIVSMQQAYAKVGGTIEQCKITDIVEDALRIETNALKNQRIEVVKKVETTAHASIDKHKVLQILINLISNARHAIAATDRGTGRIEVRCSSDSKRALIEVVDNGVGIKEEHLVKVFGFGFTTKGDGHGFGLHNAANAATEMGGTLRCTSDGPGHGATFTLELPMS